MIPDVHKHLCDKCGCIWEHRKSKVQKLPLDERHETHCCPKCGEYNGGVRYDGDDKPQVKEFYGRSKA